MFADPFAKQHGIYGNLIDKYSFSDEQKKINNLIFCQESKNNTIIFNYIITNKLKGLFTNNRLCDALGYRQVVNLAKQKFIIEPELFIDPEKTIIIQSITRKNYF